jgi:hypothetical protein
MPKVRQYISFPWHSRGQSQRWEVGKPQPHPNKFAGSSVESLRRWRGSWGWFWCRLSRSRGTWKTCSFPLMFFLSMAYRWLIWLNGYQAEIQQRWQLSGDELVIPPNLLAKREEATTLVRCFVAVTYQVVMFACRNTKLFVRDYRRWRWAWSRFQYIV